MKTLGLRQGLVKLQKLKDEFRANIADGYEFKAKSCAACDTPGACCLDAHFVNVHITELEAEAINRVLTRLPDVKRFAVFERVNNAIVDYGLSSESDRTFACPLYEVGGGCLVHEEGKPLPCIFHACYERAEDLPPDELMEEAEAAAGKLNARVYRQPAKWLSLPVGIIENLSK
jgi:hypothetical protein